MPLSARLASMSALLLACATAQRAPPPAAAPPPGEARPAPAGSPAETLAAAESALRRAEWARAETLLSDVERRSPAEARPAALRAVAIFQQGRFDEALAAARASLSRGETYEGRLIEGRVAAVQRKLEDALRSFERAAALDPRSAEARSAIAAVRLALGDQTGAERAYAEVVAFDGAHDAEQRLWTDLLRVPADPFQVQEALDRCGRGTAAYLAGNPAEAKHEMLSVLGTVPGFAHCRSELGKVAWKLGDLEESEVMFRRALAAYRPDQGGLEADTRGWLAALLVERKREAKEAVALARASLEVRGDRPATLETLARACELAQDRACARDAWGRALRAEAAPPGLRERAEARLSALGE